VNKSELLEGKDYRLIYKVVSYVPDDNGWERDYLCHKCGNNRWLVSYHTGTRPVLKNEVKLKCTQCNNWFITRLDLLHKVLGDY
jgi:hypothetical protein